VSGPAPEHQNPTLASSGPRRGFAFSYRCCSLRPEYLSQRDHPLPTKDGGTLHNRSGRQSLMLGLSKLPEPCYALAKTIVHGLLVLIT
jgi:hypothetical protein